MLRGFLEWTLLSTLMLGVHDASADPIRIMPLGDSITSGFTTGNWSEPFGFGYRGGLYKRLAKAGYYFQYVGESGQPWNYSSAGTPHPPTLLLPGTQDLRAINQDFHNGYATKNASYLDAGIVNWLDADHPDVILLMVGINDITQGSSALPTHPINSLNDLVQKIVTTTPKARLIVAQITPYSTYTNSLVQYNDYIKNTLVPHYASLGYAVTTVNQYANFLKDPSDPHSIDPARFAGGVAVNHPGNKAYDRMAETWFEGIKAVIAPPAQAPKTISATNAGAR